MGILYRISQKTFKTIVSRPVLVTKYKAFVKHHRNYGSIVLITPSTENLNAYNTMLAGTSEDKIFQELKF